MDETAPQEPPVDSKSNEPMFNAPLVVLLTALALVGLHGLVSFASYETQIRTSFDFALVPSRFWIETGGSAGYPNLLFKMLTLVSTALLHADWMHVLVNSGMLLAFGTPVARSFGPSAAGVGKWFLVFAVSIVAGSIAYLLSVGPTGAAAVGASGGVSGLMAAGMLAGPYGLVRSPLSRPFLTFTVMFLGANVLLTLAAPMALGMGIAWEAHVGGYMAGAIMMLVLGRRLPRKVEWT